MIKKTLFGFFLLVVFSAGAAWAVLGGGDIVFKVEGMSSVLYSHDVHVGKAKIGCKECHYALYTTRANHKSVTMSEMRSGKSCGACHNGIRAFSVAAKQDCGKCHNR